jgi:hypothetical protein
MRALPLALILATPAVAQDVTPQMALATLPADVAETIAARPARFADRAADMILSHGRDDALTAADIDRALALDRAFFRARALRPFLEADIDADGAVTRDEARARASVLGADGRARLLRQHGQADTDADGTLTPDELASHAQAEATRALPPQDEAMARAILAFDLNADSRVTLGEIQTTAAALSQDG